MKNRRNRKEMAEILSKIEKIVPKEKEEIDFSEIKKKIIEFTEFYLPITEEEVEEIFTEYDIVLFDGEYHEFLEQKKFENKLLDWIRIVAIDEKIGKMTKSEIKERVGYIVAEFDKHNQGLPKELLSNYDVIFDEQYKKYLELSKSEILILSYINKKDKNRVITDKDKIKGEIKKTIQNMNSSSASKMSFNVEEILENYDLIFEWAYERSIEKVKIAGLLQTQKAGEIREMIERWHQEDIAKRDYIMNRVIGNKEKRKEFIASMRPNTNQKGALARGKEEVEYMTISGGDIIFHNKEGKDKKGRKKEIEIMEFMKNPRKRKIIEFPQKNSEAEKEEKEDDRWQK